MLQLVIESILPGPPAEPILPPEVAGKSRRAENATRPITFDAASLKLVRSLSRWAAISGLATLALGIGGVRLYLEGRTQAPLSVAAVLMAALGLWQLAAANRFRQVARGKGGQSHQLINGFGLLRSALLLKAVVVFLGMTLGCFTFSIATSLLLLL